MPLFKNLDFKQRLYLIVGSALVLSVLLLFFNYYIILRISDNAGQIQKHRESLMTRSALINRESFLRSDLKKAQEGEVYLNNILPDSDRLIDFPRDVSIWASQAGIDVGFSFIKEAAGDDSEPGFTTFILTGAGPLSGVLNFLRLIERGRYFIQFNQYEIMSENNRYTLLINGQIFSK